jgi:hypothetical protein
LLFQKEVFMPYIDPEVIQEAKRMDLFTYLRNYEPQELVRFSGNVYCTRAHDSLKISNGKWCWHSRGIGGRSALDYLIKVNGMSFLEAVGQIAERTAIRPPAPVSEKKEPARAFVLPKRDGSRAEVERYLHERRGISREVIRYCTDLGILYQTRRGRYVNAVFVGNDKDKIPRHASVRGIHGDFKGDADGSDKRYSFALANGSARLHLFESAIDLLSFATLVGFRIQNPFDGDMLSLSGVYKPKQNIEESTLPPALMQYLEDHPQICSIHLHLDNDLAGRLAAKAIMTVLPKRYKMTDEPPPAGSKDMSDHLCDRLGLPRSPVREGGVAR